MLYIARDYYISNYNFHESEIWKQRVIVMCWDICLTFNN